MKNKYITLKEVKLKPVKPDSFFDKKQLAAGVKVESEHTLNKTLAKIIAKHHLLEKEDYYIKRKKVESK